MEIKFNRFLNEELSMLSTDRLRDSIHDIIVKLKRKDTLDLNELSNRLYSDYKISISTEFLNKIFDDFIKSKKGEDSPDSIFDKRSDSRWLGVREIEKNKKKNKELRNNLYFLKPNLAKHRERLTIQLGAEKLEKSYKEGLPGLEFQEDIIKKTFVLQHPEDSKYIIMEIYKAAKVDKRYENSYENCWKMMMVLGKKMGLDKARGYLDFAPANIRQEYYETKEMDLTLVKTPEKEKQAPSTPPIEGIPTGLDVKVGDEVIYFNSLGTKIKSKALSDSHKLEIPINNVNPTVQTGEYTHRTTVNNSEGKLRRLYWNSRLKIWIFSLDLNKMDQNELEMNMSPNELVNATDLKKNP